MTSDSFRVIYVWSGILRSFTNVCKIEKKTTTRKKIIFTVSAIKEMCWLAGDRLFNSSRHALRRCKVLCRQTFSHWKLIHQHVKTLMRLGCYAMSDSFCETLNVQVERSTRHSAGAICSSICFISPLTNERLEGSYSVYLQMIKCKETRSALRTKTAELILHRLNKKVIGEGFRLQGLVLFCSDSFSCSY